MGPPRRERKRQTNGGTLTQSGGRGAGSGRGLAWRPCCIELTSTGLLDELKADGFEACLRQAGVDERVAIDDQEGDAQLLAATAAVSITRAWAYAGVDRSTKFIKTAFCS